MMNRHILSCLIFLGTFFSLKAQKVDLDPFHFKFEFRNLPHTPVDTSFTTYSILVDAPSSVRRAKSAEAIASDIRLEGFSKVSSDGDIRIDIAFNDVIITDHEIVENVYTSKNKDGSEKKTYSYFIKLKYSFSGTADFMDKSDGLIAKPMTLGDKENAWSSSSYSSRSEAESYYNSNRTAIISNLTRERLAEATKRINSFINYNFGFPVENHDYYLWLLDSKKHPEYEAMKIRWDALKPVIQRATANTFSSDDQSMIKEMIRYFDELKEKYGKDEKGDKKMRYAAWYNNAMLYLLLDDPKSAMKEADGLVANAYDEKDGKKLRETAEELEALFILNSVKSRHFTPRNAE